MRRCFLCVNEFWVILRSDRLLPSQCSSTCASSSFQIGAGVQWRHLTFHRVKPLPRDPAPPSAQEASFSTLGMIKRERECGDYGSSRVRCRRKVSRTNDTLIAHSDLPCARWLGTLGCLGLFERFKFDCFDVREFGLLSVLLVSIWDSNLWTFRRVSVRCWYIGIGHVGAQNCGTGTGRHCRESMNHGQSTEPLQRTAPAPRRRDKKRDETVGNVTG